MGSKQRDPVKISAPPPTRPGHMRTDLTRAELSSRLSSMRFPADMRWSDRCQAFASPFM